MRILNLYADTDGQSHFREIEIECSEETPRGGIKVSKQLPATAIIFVEGAGTNLVPLHPAPWRQFVINLDAELEVIASDGERRVIGAGEVVVIAHLLNHVGRGLGFWAAGERHFRLKRAVRAALAMGMEKSSGSKSSPSHSRRSARSGWAGSARI